MTYAVADIVMNGAGVRYQMGETVNDFWIFGYGSLMWRPGFAYEEAVPAQLVGAHRALCVYSVVHRGSRRNPGLVLGLDAGGTCDGLAFRVRRTHARRTQQYLRAREQVTRVYREVVRPVQLLDGDALPVRALCFLIDQCHPQYAGRLPVTEQAYLVRRGYGMSGHNRDYVANTVRHLSGMGIEEPRLNRLMPLLGIRHSELRALPCEREPKPET